MQSHEYANIFPMMNEAEFDELCKDMAKNGYRPENPIITYEGKILDGRNRFKASETVGILPMFTEYGGGDPLGFVLSQNLHRRHLNESQRGVVASRLANMKRGEYHGNQYDDLVSANLQTPQLSQSEAAELLNVSPRTVATIKAVEKEAPEFIPMIDSGEMTANKAWTETKRKQVVENLQSIEVQEAKALEGVYDVIVIDPPWPMEKIERDIERPNQVSFDYPVMQVSEIGQIKLPCADNCHVFLWTTQKFLPNAFAIFMTWNIKYICAFNWHKAGGFQPYNLPQYNNEFVLYGRVGSPAFIDTKDFKTSFEGKRTGHSEKPEEFYATLRRVTAGRRLDMFNRRKIDGFDGWGKEAQ